VPNLLSKQNKVGMPKGIARRVAAIGWVRKGERPQMGWRPLPPPADRSRAEDAQPSLETKQGWGAGRYFKLLGYVFPGAFDLSLSATNCRLIVPHADPNTRIRQAFAD
jgi:hypothetical protein